MNQLREIINNFETLNNHEWSELLLIATSQSLKKGSFFLQKGEVCQHSAFVEKGNLRHFMIDTSGKQKILQFSMQNEFVSDCESYMNQQPAYYSIQAIEDTTIILFNNSQLKNLSEQYPVLGQVNNQIIHQILSKYKEHIMILMNLSPHEKYQYLLDNKPEFILRISVTYLSQFLGLSRETVSRLRAKNNLIK